MKVLIVGLGSIAKKHINALISINETIEIFALRSSKNAKKIEHVTNIFELNGNINYDFAIISTPTYLHYENILHLSDLKIPLFIEKPLFSKLPKDQSLFEKIKESNIPTYVACNIRFLDCLAYVKKEIVGKYRVNEINSYCGSFLPDWRPGEEYKSNYSSNKHEGGGVHLDLIHELDYIYWLFGAPKKVKRFLTSNSTLEITAFDYANYILKYQDFSASIILNYYRRIPKRSLEILTSKYVFEINLLKNEIYRNGILYYKSEQRLIDTYKSQMQFFMSNIIKKNISNFNNIFEAQEVLKLALNEEFR